MAARKPAQLKDTSVTDAIATPPTMGTRVATTAMEGTSPRNSDESTTEKKGSIALMVCVKDTATLPRLTLVRMLPSVCTAARGRIGSSVLASTSLGGLCAPET